MKVAILNNGITGGAAFAAMRLHNALLLEGVESYFITTCAHSNNPNVISVQPNIINKLGKHFFPGLGVKNYKNISAQFNGTFSFSNIWSNIHNLEILENVDIINLHWIGGMLNQKAFFKKFKDKPLVWTLHDMNPFLGFCHYKGDLQDADFLAEYDKELRIHKQLLYNELKNLSIVTLCNWMKSSSEESDSFNKFPHYIIPNSIDTSIYKLRDKQSARRLLEIPEGKIVLMFGCQYINDKRKGGDLLSEAIGLIDNPDLHLLIVGEGKPNFNHCSYQYFGRVNDERLMSILYNSADAFILPSREDNLPNTMLESLCCGTSVISFNTGGMADQIFTGFNGILAEEINALSLKKCISDFLDHKYQFDRRKISADAINKFCYQRQAQSYIDLYKSLI